MIPICVQTAMPDDILRLPYPSPDAVGGVAQPAHSGKLTLFDLPLHVVGRVAGIDRGSDDSAELALRLLEIGFVPGESVRVIAHGHPGREPVAVRIGGTTFALRRFEAERVLVALDSRRALA